MSYKVVTNPGYKIINNRFYIMKFKGNAICLSRPVYCRDALAREWTNKYLAYKIGKASFEQIIKKIQEAEEKLKLKNKSEFLDNNISGLLAIKCSPFWTYRKINRSFLTALIKGHHERLIKRHHESRNRYFYNSYAYERFLSGYTKLAPKTPVNGAFGWSYIFHGKNTRETNELLYAKKSLKW